MPDDPTTYGRAEQADSLEVGDRLVIYNSATRTSLVLNPTGAVVWRLLESPHNADGLAQALAARFPDVDRQSIEADIAKHLAELVEHGVVVVVE